MMPADTGQGSRLELLTEFLRRRMGEAGESSATALLPWLDWRHIAGGEMLFRAGDAADELYLVASGRLRVVGRPGFDAGAADAEVRRGQIIGEAEFLTGEPRAETLVGMRDSVLAILTRGAYEEIARRDPPLALRLVRLLADRFRRRPPAGSGAGRPTNLCLVPITEGVDVLELAYALARRLSFGNRVLVICREAMFGRSGAATGDDLSAEQYRQFAEWLDEVECSHEFLIFVTEARPGEWTRRCIRDSDEVVLLARADAAPTAHPVEGCLDDADIGVAVRRTLVLLHDEHVRMPTATHRWLTGRSVAAHLHVRPAVDRDIGRLARILSGTSVGLVLSGGGARGFAHLGVLKALEEFGAQIDSIGGASIGAVMGAYSAFDLPAEVAIELARRAFAAGPTRDVNWLPLISVIGGRRLKTVIDDAVVAATGCLINVEDTWKSLYCVVANYTRAAEVVVSRGDLAKWLRTSVSIPGVLPAVPHHGELMGDGGTFNNFPTDVMRRQGVGYLVGSDLLQGRYAPLDNDEVPSTWQALLDRLRPRHRRRLRFPSLTSTLVSTTMLVSQSRQREARQRADLCFAPPLEGIGMLDWSRFDAIVELGYRHANGLLAGLSESQAARLRGTAATTAAPPGLEHGTGWQQDFIVP